MAGGNDKTSTYAVLGATGNCGSAIIETLLERPNVRVNAFCRDRAKLLRRFPGLEEKRNVTLFEGGLQNQELLTSCVAQCRAVFLCISSNDNIPDCRLALDTADAVIKALKGFSINNKQSRETLPKIVLLSSGTVDETFSKHVPWLLLPILLRSASYVYEDLRRAEELLRKEESWLTSIYMKPGALSVDERKGYALSMTDQTGPTSYLDLASAMIEVVEEPSTKYDQASVSTICTNGPAKFPSGTPMCISTGLLRHYFPALHPYLPMGTGPK